MKKRNKWQLLFPILVIGLSLVGNLLIPKSSLDFTKTYPAYTTLLVVALGVVSLQALLYLLKGWGKKFYFQTWLIGGNFFLLFVYNLLTEKWQVLPKMYFPSVDRILNIFIEKYPLLISCVYHSLVLLFSGMFFGIVSGFVTGILIGWFKNWHYWLAPFTRIMGPIPSTAFLPIAIVAFPKATQASVFLIAFSVWFQVAILTNSGVSNVKKTYYEVADTLGASQWQKIYRVAIPAALPNIFVGIFNGLCASFVTLMVAEMVGVKNGIGWFVNWQKEVLNYPGVYAGLLIIAVIFSFLITILFRIRDIFLAWQKGFIQW